MTSASPGEPGSGFHAQRGRRGRGPVATMTTSGRSARTVTGVASAARRISTPSSRQRATWLRTRSRSSPRPAPWRQGGRGLQARLPVRRRSPRDRPPPPRSPPADPRDRRPRPRPSAVSLHPPPTGTRPPLPALPAGSPCSEASSYGGRGPRTPGCTRSRDRSSRCGRRAPWRRIGGR